MPALFFIGSQEDQPGHGIVAAQLDEETGVLSPTGVAATVARPTWMHVDRARGLLFAVSEVGNAGDRNGEVLSYAIHSDRLTPIGRVDSAGGGATHLDHTQDGTTLFVANFGGGTVAALPVQPDGRLEPAASVEATSGTGPHRRQTKPHPHGVTLTPDERFLLVPDMGADRIFVYRFDVATRSLSPAQPSSVSLPAGSGPRLIVFGADGRHAYLLTELSAELFVFAWSDDDGLTEVGHMALDAPGAGDNRSAAMLIRSADGRFLYVSNRTTDAIHVFATDAQNGSLEPIQIIAAGGVKPWGGALSPRGRWLVVANQGSDAVTVFAVDPATGMLTATGAGLTVATPTGIAFA